MSTNTIEGLLFTWTEGCDHEILRALGTQPKAVPWEIGFQTSMVKAWCEVKLDHV